MEETLKKAEEKRTGKYHQPAAPGRGRYPGGFRGYHAGAFTTGEEHDAADGVHRTAA